ncbi:MAG TPA: hypothetical protein VJ953_14115 [Saprospiraceae bacterium]|nr:hypothetical protein [Saprospiraceae bacterium]
MRNLIIVVICFLLSVQGFSQSSANGQVHTSKGKAISPAVDIGFKGKRKKVRYENYTNCQAWYNDCTTGKIGTPTGFTCRDAATCSVENGAVNIEYDNTKIDMKSIENKDYAPKAIDIRFKGDRRPYRYDSYTSCKTWYDDCTSGQLLLPQGYTCRDANTCRIVNGVVNIDFFKIGLDKPSKRKASIKKFGKYKSGNK